MKAETNCGISLIPVRTDENLQHSDICQATIVMKDNGFNLNDTNSEPFYSENLEEDLEGMEHT